MWMTRILLSCAMLLLLVSCNNNGTDPLPTIDLRTPTVPSEDAPPVEIVVEPTAVTLVAQVNGRPISQEAYELQFSQYERWYPDGSPTGTPLDQYVLDTLIEQQILEQSAETYQVSISDEMVEQRKQNAISDVGGAESFIVWLDTSGYVDEQSFIAQLRYEMTKQSVMEALGEELVPYTAESVRARYIQVDELTLANNILRQLTLGANFEEMVLAYSLDPFKETRKGDLGVFQENTLLVPEIETAAFALELNELSEVIPLARGDGSTHYAIVQTVERNPYASISAQDRPDLVQKAFTAWLQAEKETQTIEVY